MNNSKYSISQQQTSSSPLFITIKTYFSFYYMLFKSPWKGTKKHARQGERKRKFSDVNGKWMTMKTSINQMNNGSWKLSLIKQHNNNVVQQHTTIGSNISSNNNSYYYYYFYKTVYHKINKQINNDAILTTTTTTTAKISDNSTMSEDKTHLAIQAVLYIAPGILHLCGLYLLFVVKNLGPAEEQRAFLVNLSISEAGFCFMKMAHRFLFLFGHNEIARKIWIFQTGFFFTEVCLIMDMLTVDRFLAVFLNIRYKKYATNRAVNFCILISWIISGMLYLICFLVVDIKDVVNLFTFFIWPIEQYSFLLIAIPVYVYIFIKISKNRRKMKILRRRLSSDPSSLTTGFVVVNQASVSTSSRVKKHSFSVSAREKIKKNTFVPFLLIATFMLFWLVPDQIQLGLLVTINYIPPEIHFFSNLSYIVAALCDGLIYIIGTPRVRQLLKQRLKK